MPVLGIVASSTRQGLSTTAFWALDTYTFPDASSNTITFNSIPQTYKHLMIVFQAWGTVNDGTHLRFNGDTGASNYFAPTGGLGDGVAASTNLGVVASSAVDVFNLLGGYGSTQTTAGVGYINDYSTTNKFKTVTAIRSNLNSSNEGNVASFSGARTSSTDAITSLTFSARTGNFNTNSTIALFGIL